MQMILKVKTGIKDCNIVLSKMYNIDNKHRCCLIIHFREFMYVLFGMFTIIRYYITKQKFTHPDTAYIYVYFILKKIQCR